MIEMAILGLLKDRAMHGYELKKELTAQLGQFWQASYGSLYPSVRRLEKNGMVERYYPKEEVTRRKNIYRITPAGEELFTQRLCERTPIVDDARFGVRFAFFRYMNTTDRVDLLERRRAYLLEMAADLKEKLRSYKEKIDDYTYRLMEHRVDTTRADIEWIDHLIAEEKLNQSTNLKGKPAS
ncbi:MAG TPA: PadR family transcriptional regulator [Actinomycetota bacterium]|nr:PadR family transcriptional regulator [Actinomycetota bacterium]